MNILIVSSSFYPKIDGSVRCVYDHGRMLAQRGHNVYLVTRKVNGSPAYESIAGIKVVRASPSFKRGSFWNKIRLFLNQVGLIVMLHKRVKFNIIHSHGVYPALSALPTKFLFKIPLLITTHGTEFLWPSWCWWKSSIELKLSLLVNRYVMGKADYIIAQSDGVKSYMCDIWGEHLMNKIRIIPTGVDESKFRKLDHPEPDKPIILFVGGLSKVKGIDTLIKAASEVLKRLPQALFVIVGGGPLRRNLEKLSEQLGVKSSVIFKGAVTDDNALTDLYNKARIVVLPSNVGGPVACTILEGMSVGKPVISTNVTGGIPDVIKNGETGILVRPRDSDQLANAIIRLLMNPELARRMGDLGRESVEAKYSLSQVTKQLEYLYKELALDV